MQNRITSRDARVFDLADPMLDLNETPIVLATPASLGLVPRDAPAVYRIMALGAAGEDGAFPAETLYVGASIHPRSRLTSHMRDGRWRSDGHILAFGVTVCPNVRVMTSLERTLIEAIQPKGNAAGVTVPYAADASWADA